MILQVSEYTLIYFLRDVTVYGARSIPNRRVAESKPSFRIHNTYSNHGTEAHTARRCFCTHGNIARSWPLLKRVPEQEETKNRTSLDKRRSNIPAESRQNMLVRIVKEVEFI